MASLLWWSIYQLFVLLPVSITGPWYSKKKQQTNKQTKKKLADTGRSESGFTEKQEGSGLNY